MSGSWIQTFTGVAFDPLNAKPAQVRLIDIAHALSNICRFTGHVRRFYSVAEHCVRVSHVLPPELALAGLLHDASEAYMLDLSYPLKIQPQFQAYRDAEAELEKVIGARFGVELTPMHPDVKVADRRMCLTEARALFGTLLPGWSTGGLEPYEEMRITGWEPFEARIRFLARFDVLTHTTDAKLDRVLNPDYSRTRTYLNVTGVGSGQEAA